MPLSIHSAKPLAQAPVGVATIKASPYKGAVSAGYRGNRAFADALHP
jgi:hypothetical protein